MVVHYDGVNAQRVQFWQRVQDIRQVMKSRCGISLRNIGVGNHFMNATSVNTASPLAYRQAL